jgi:hypothetical protein
VLGVVGAHGGEVLVAAWVGVAGEPLAPQFYRLPDAGLGPVV